MVFLADLLLANDFKKVDELHTIFEVGKYAFEFNSALAEVLGCPARENFDLCVSRAVANLASLSEYCLPFVTQGGSFISYKSGEIEAELSQSKKAIFVLGGKIESVKKFRLVETDAERSFVQIKKVKKTPKTYPRKAGTPSKNPIQ